MRSVSATTILLMLPAFAFAGAAACETEPPSKRNFPAEDSSATEASADASLDAPVGCVATPCVTQIAIGGTHTCARIDDGTVRCWGSNLDGELGVGESSDAGFDGGIRTTPVSPAVTGVASVAAGGVGQSDNFSCALGLDRSASCWGSDRYGQLARSGDGGARPLSNPQPVSGLNDALELRAGGGHACALLAQGEVSCWGFNGLDQLGRADAGLSASVPGSVTLPKPAREIATGQFHTCALLVDGTVACWGGNAHGQLGRTLDGALQDAHPDLVSGLSGVAQIAAGNLHTCSILDGGLLLCWGRNDRGQTGRGIGGGVDEPSPALVALPGGSKVAQVSAGLLHSCAVVTDGSVWCWGANQAGAVAVRTQADGGFDASDVVTPTRVNGLPGPALSVHAGYLHTCALIAGGSVMCWGSNQFGELGRGSAAPDTDPHPEPSLVRF